MRGASNLYMLDKTCTCKRVAEMHWATVSPSGKHHYLQAACTFRRCAVAAGLFWMSQLSRVVCCTLRRLLLFALLVQKSYQDCPKAQCRIANLCARESPS